MADQGHEFGGVSTDLKLSMVQGYLEAFTKALRNKFPQLWYIDAFAGTGERTVRMDAAPATLFNDETPERIEQRRGSALIAIETKPEFSRLVFMEKKTKHCEALRALASANRHRRIDVLQGDANEEIARLIDQQTWRSTRAVMFLDPYGMSVDWETLTRIRATEAIDVWYLVSLAGLFRQAPRDEAAIDLNKRAAISRMLGTEKWQDDWYNEDNNLDLFGEARRSRFMEIPDMQNYIHSRLKTIFPAVLKPLTLRNDSNVPMFALFFAISNPNPSAIRLATDIAGYILNSGRESQVLPR
ncbi:three-Cys-motif partner protein TcmP [Alsobacter sp. KACC 23698]|uniref:Three-Cys-motif partner protein TcmP n=1 Tax=Alsobacter sp. KACC 23698 TaxID=3149229 RepID=A0AAU7JBM7_9HYPH